MKICSPTGSTPTSRGRIALIVPCWTDPEVAEPQGTPFRSFTIGGAFLAAGYEVVFFDQEHDLDRHDRWDEFAAELLDCSAAFLWMNEMYPFNQCTNASLLARRIKQERPELPVVVGGEFITICPEGFFDFEVDGIDFFLRGYGEESGLLLVEALRQGREPVDVPGIVFRTADGRSIDRPAHRPAHFHSEWLELYRQVDMSVYVQRGGVLGNDQPTLTIAAGRGCVKGCGFCAWSNHTARLLGAEDYLELMTTLHDRYGVKQFHIGELDFFTAPKRALRLAEGLRAHGTGIVWFALGSPVDLVRLSDDDWRTLFEGGLRKVEVGSESGSDELLPKIGKPHQAEDIYRCSEAMVRSGIRPMNNFLFGFPGETRADRAASLQMIDRLHRLSPSRCHFTYRYFQPVWNTPLGDEALAHEVDPPRRLDDWLARRHGYHVDGERALQWVSAEDEEDIKQLVNFQLPLATSAVPVGRKWRNRVYEQLRTRARNATASDRRVHRLDRWLYRRTIGAGLDQTYIP